MFTKWSLHVRSTRTPRYPMYIFCHLCNAIAVCKSVHQNSPAIQASFSRKTSNTCKRKYFALNGFVSFKTFPEYHFGKHVFSSVNRDFSAMFGLFKSRIKNAGRINLPCMGNEMGYIFRFEKSYLPDLERS